MDDDQIIIYQPRHGSAVRVFRPKEMRALIRAVDKNEYKDKIEALLLTGARYSEIKWLFDHKARFRGNSIHMRNAKSKSSGGYRYIRINRQGQRAVDNFLRSKTNLPSYQSWGRDMKRWCEKAGIPPDHACAKSTRKTFESWLILTYPHRIFEILISMGHKGTTALNHYLTFPFTDEDRQDMLYFVEGW